MRKFHEITNAKIPGKTKFEYSAKYERKFSYFFSDSLRLLETLVQN